jgi:putative tricarboxylic transport membrane protein
MIKMNSSNRLHLSLVLLLLFVLAQGTQAAFPDKPISLIVHTKPGGAVDLMARQVAQIASKYCDQPLVVVNKPGGSGLLAMAKVVGEKPDGYTLMAYAAAFVPTLQTTDIGFGIEAFHPLACLTISPEALITNRHSSQRDFQAVLDEARAHPGEQRWCGPGSGSFDHLMAVKTMALAKIDVKWIPYGGGGSAVAAVMGQHAHVYVGNPEDLLGREENLFLAAVSSPERLPRYPDTPTLAEFGLDLNSEVMWRGFAVKAGTDVALIQWYMDLLLKVSQDPGWLQFVERTGVQSVFLPHDEFNTLIQSDVESSQEYLELAGFSIGKQPEQAPLVPVFFVGLLIVGILVVLTVLKAKKQASNGTLWISLFCVSLALTAYYMSFWFPLPRAGTFVGAATVPRVWIFVLTSLAGAQLILMLRPAGKVLPVKSGHVSRVWRVVALLIVFSVMVPFAGFFPAAAILLLGGIYLLDYRNHLVVLAVAGCVLSAMYVVFIQVLSVPLPMGIWG